MNPYEETGPRSDRELTDEWRRTMYSESKAIHATLRSFGWGIVWIVVLLALILWRLWR